MFNCQVCGRSEGPNKPRNFYNLYRQDGQISREIPVCERCNGLLKSGVTLAQLVEALAKTRKKEEVLEQSTVESELLPVRSIMGQKPTVEGKKLIPRFRPKDGKPVAINP